MGLFPGVGQRSSRIQARISALDAVLTYLQSSITNNVALEAISSNSHWIGGCFGPLVPVWLCFPELLFLFSVSMFLGTVALVRCRCVGSCAVHADISTLHVQVFHADDTSVCVCGFFMFCFVAFVPLFYILFFLACFLAVFFLASFLLSRFFFLSLSLSLSLSHF